MYVDTPKQPFYVVRILLGHILLEQNDSLCWAIKRPLGKMCQQRKAYCVFILLNNSLLREHSSKIPNKQLWTHMEYDIF